MQAVQNFAASIVSGSKKYDHISLVLKDLRWLPLEFTGLYYYIETDTNGLFQKLPEEQFNF